MFLDMEQPQKLCTNNNNNRIDSLRQICTIIRAISLPNKEHMEN